MIRETWKLTTNPFYIITCFAIIGGFSLFKFFFKKEVLETGYLYGIQNDCVEVPVLLKYIRFEEDRKEILRCYVEGYFTCEILNIEEHHLSLHHDPMQQIEVVEVYEDFPLLEVRGKRISDDGYEYGEYYAYVHKSLFRTDPPSRERMECVYQPEL